MNRVYFVRHAKPDFSVKDELIRPLSPEGIDSSKKVKKFLKDKNISRIYSSPYKRSIDTVKELSDFLHLDIEVIEDFRERKICDNWIEDFNGFCEKQWNDFSYRLNNGESLREVQARNIKELHRILNECKEENIVIGTHGTALSTIINYYDTNFNYASFYKIKDIMPLTVSCEFNGINLKDIKYILEL
ncbi:histidine phosphatase family protein [uncultured Clostridium sp.]|uniref:histidine phosphatase family protein n=2 Tax=Clostridium TaxID=1485 RepID=UPI00258B83FE|nr:histidine phosphatase family protein [uncultured Clostridium sp.]